MDKKQLDNLKSMDDHTLLIVLLAEVHSIKSEYVTRHEFAPVRLIVYGMVGCLITGTVGALLAMLVSKGG